MVVLAGLVGVVPLGLVLTRSRSERIDTVRSEGVLADDPHTTHADERERCVKRWIYLLCSEADRGLGEQSFGGCQRFLGEVKMGCNDGSLRGLEEKVQAEADEAVGGSGADGAALV